MKDGISVWLPDFVILGKFLGDTVAYWLSCISLVRILSLSLTNSDPKQVNYLTFLYLHFVF